MFEELDFQPTPMGDLMLRRRSEPRLDGKIVYEVKLGEEFLMSSLFVEAEVALTELGLAPLAERSDLSVVVGGLGLGYTAGAVLDNPSVSQLVIVETMSEVISWHQRSLVPLGERLSSDPRTCYHNGDFFALCAHGGFDPGATDTCFDAILLDIDHSPRHVLDPSHTRFYSSEGLKELRARLKPGGVFALWSNDAPDSDYEAVAAEVFASTSSHVVEFENPLMGGVSSNTVYVAQI